jgi:Zn-dependent oligopeptidase
MNKILKNKIILELENPEIPNLKFLFSQEVLKVSEELLLELLEEEKVDFENKLKIPNEYINFETFDEDSKMSYFWSLLNHLNSVKSNEKVRNIIENVEPKLIDFWNEISYSKRFFEMFQYCYKNSTLDEEQNKIIADTVKNYEIKWINLPKKDQEKLKIISSELSELTTKFSNNVLDSEKEFEYFIETDEFLKEFPESDLANAKNLASEKNKKWYAFDSSSSSYISIMKYCSSSEIRKYFADAHSSFASNWKYDNRENVLKIINLKDKKAKLLWYKNYAGLSLEFKMAESSKQVIDLLSDLWTKAKPKALDEIEEIKSFFNLEDINSWDMGYYSRILKEKKYKLDDKKLKQYFEFENTQKALFETVGNLYWIKMEKIDFEWKYDENVEIYKVYKNNKFISYFIWDYFYNPGKRSGAWADEVRDRFKNKKSIVINVMSLVKSKEWKTLMTLWEVTTLFHEFGHAIHSMLSKSSHSELSGFWVEWDFVELPSQILEKWAEDDLTISNVASHYETWEKLPLELLESLKRLKYFGTWNFVLWQSSYAVIDMMFYSGEQFSSVEDLDEKYLKKINDLSIFKKEDNYKMYASFSHIFAGWYSAWYYSYIWADILVDEIWTEFKKNWVYDKKTASKFEEKILWAGSIKKALDMFEDFMWRWVKIDAFLEEKGLK